MENVETVLIAKFVEPFRSQDDKEYPPVTYYGATNGRVFAIFPKPEHNSNSLDFILVVCTGLYFLFERKEVYILKERWRQLKNLEQELQYYSRNVLNVLKSAKTHKEAEEYLNSMLHPIEISSH